MLTGGPPGREGCRRLFFDGNNIIDAGSTVSFPSLRRRRCSDVRVRVSEIVRNGHFLKKQQGRI